MTNYDIDINNKEADLKEESCESSFKVNEDYEMEEDEEFAERNFYHTYLFCYCYVYGQLSCRFVSFILRLKKEKKYSLVFLLFLVVVFLKCERYLTELKNLSKDILMPSPYHSLALILIRLKIISVISSAICKLHMREERG